MQLTAVLNILRAMIPDATLRAYVLAGVRWLGAAVGAAVGAFLIKGGMSTGDTATIVTALTALIVAIGSGVLNIVDVQSVGAQQAVTKATVANKIIAANADPNALQAIISDLLKG